MNKDNQEQQRPRQQGNVRVEKKQSPLAVENEAHYEVYLNKLQHLAMNQIPVMMNPELHPVNKIASDARYMGHFIQIKFNPDTMSHMIINVMPHMDTMMKLSDGSEDFGEMSDQEAIDNVLDAMLDRAKEEKASE